METHKGAVKRVERMRLETDNWTVVHGPYLFRAGKTLNTGLRQIKNKVRICLKSKNKAEAQVLELSQGPIRSDDRNGFNPSCTRQRSAFPQSLCC